MATYVLVHGGGHGGWCYQRVARILRAAGHEVYTPTLTGCGERSHLLSPGTDLVLHVEDVVQVLRYEDLHDVILAGHSYGGMVITGVADRALDRIGWLVFLDAAMPKDGESLHVVAKEAMDFAYSEMFVRDGVELVMPPGSATVAMLGVSRPDDVAFMSPKLTPHPWKTFSQPLRLEHEDRVKGLRRAIVNCTPTLASRPPERMAEAFDGERVFEIDTGHDLMITEPQQTADALLALAE